MTAPVRTSAQEGSRTASSEESVQERDGAASDHYKNRDYMKVQWDLVKGVPGTPPFTYLAERGGTATAYAEDGSKIILTGSGTFRVPSGRVTGGGN
ncbi:MAG: hypothetical protein J2P31_06520, partial [Blastocatellia bacterium]|nr:hypothetical protein [Blastocatellia bacterium]